MENSILFFFEPFPYADFKMILCINNLISNFQVFELVGVIDYLPKLSTMIGKQVNFDNHSISFVQNKG